MGTLTANTTASLSNLLPSFYDKVLLETFDKTVRFQQFAQNKSVPRDMGKSVTWNRATRLGLGYKLTEGTRPSSTALSTVQISALVEQYGQYVALTDFIDLTSINDVTKMAVSRLGKSAGETIDTVIQQAIIEHANLTAVSVNHYVKQSAQQYFSTAQSAAQSVNANSLLAVSDINAITAKLRGYDVPGYDKSGSYVGIASEEVLKGLRNDSTWQNWNQYTDSSPLFNGEIGKIHGVRLINTTFGRVSAGSANGGALSADTGISALAYATMIFGKDWFGAVDLGGKNVEIITSTQPTKEDPLNQLHTIGWKAFFSAKVLNVSAGVVVWSGNGETMAGASTASARTAAGLRILEPTTST